ncbi:MAG: hypothetical protein O2U61_06645 [Candidatus Bathyarchaeota archaeon]|nr:hypothetical protein [Candidatus Bathyarchaeota archaeon]
MPREIKQLLWFQFVALIVCLCAVYVFFSLTQHMIYTTLFSFIILGATSCIINNIRARCSGAGPAFLVPFGLTFLVFFNELIFKPWNFAHIPLKIILLMVFVLLNYGVCSLVVEKCNKNFMDWHSLDENNYGLIIGQVILILIGMEIIFHVAPPWLNSG